MPTLEGSLRAANKIGLQNNTVQEAKHVVKERRAAFDALQAACESNEEVALTGALKVGTRNGLSGSRLMDEAERRLDGLALGKLRASNIEKARKMRDAHRKGGPTGDEKPTNATDGMTLVSKRTRRHGLKEAQVPLMSLARTPPSALEELVPKKLPMQVTWEKMDVSSKTGELFLKGAQHLCERTAEGQSVLEITIRAAAAGSDEHFNLAVQRVTRASACFVAAQRSALAAYGVLHTSTMNALEQWQLSTHMPELTVKEARQGVRDAQMDLQAATNALMAHRTKHAPNSEARLLHCREEEGLARALLVRGRAKLADLGTPMTDESNHAWEVSMLSGRLERLGHFLHQARDDLEHFNPHSSRSAVRRALALIKGQVRLNEAAPDPLVELLQTVSEALDHPVTSGIIFSADTTFAVGSRAWANGPQMTASKPSSPSLPMLSHSSSAPLLEDEFILPRGLFVAPQRLSRPSTSAGLLTVLEPVRAASPALDESPNRSGLKTSASQPVFTGAVRHTIATPSSRMLDEVKLDRMRRTTPVRSKFHIAVDDSLAGMNGSGRVLYDELNRLCKELNRRLHPPSLEETGLDLDPSGLVRVLITGLQAWTAHHEERERQRYEARDLAVAQELARKRAAALYTHTPIDEAGAVSAMEKLRKALAANLERTMDFFRDCDADQSGHIDRREFRRAIDKVVPGVSKGVCAALFDLIDTDKSNSIEYNEIHAQLRTREEFRPPKKGVPREPRRRTGNVNARLELYHKKFSRPAFEVKSRGRHFEF